jgi:predicted ATPase with chaperone activity
MRGDAKKGRPGEVQLARHGILILDEVVEFSSSTLACTLRGAAAWTGWLVMTTTPCYCGFLGHVDRQCLCTKGSLERFTARLDAIRKMTGATEVRAKAASLDADRMGQRVTPLPCVEALCAAMGLA